MTTSSIQIRNDGPLDNTHEDLRPMSRREFQAVLSMIATAVILYVVIMRVFVAS